MPRRTLSRSHRRPDRARAPRELRDLRVDPRKSLGQHFLVDEMVLDDIIALAEVGKEDVVLEIGAGLGALTQALAATGARVLAVEIDEGLCTFLRQRFRDDSVQIACTDILALSPAELLRLHELEPPYIVVANLPYYITALVLRHLLEAGEPPQRLVVMVQREVAQRIAARAPKLSLLGVSVQAYAEPTLGPTVPPHAFYPPPKVDSAIVRLDVRRHPSLPADPEPFFRMVHAGFSQPRKQLHNAIAASLWAPPNAVPDILRKAGIDPSRRAQTLSIDEWARLTEVYFAQRLQWDTSH